MALLGSTMLDMRKLALVAVFLVACSSGVAPPDATSRTTTQPLVTVSTATEGPSPTSPPRPATLTPPTPPPAGGGLITETRSGLARHGPDAAADDQLAALVEADRAFALDLYRELVATEQGNLFFSPYSISTAFSMTLAGARGETANELATALHADDAAFWHPARNRLELELAALAEYEPPGEGDAVPLTLETINALFGQKGFPFVPEYLDLLAADYGAGMNIVDFANAWEAARAAINEWVAERTNDRIEELLPEGSIHDLTRLVLVNAIFFKANWIRRFNPELTAPAPFHLLDGSTIDVPLMHDHDKYQYAEGDGWQSVELQYHGGASMVVIAPTEGRFAEIEQSLDADLLVSATSFNEHLVDLAVPRWESESSLDLIPPMESLGVKLLFGPDFADLTGIADVGLNLYVSDAFHQASITVDEDGTEAAAATAVVGSLDSGAPPATLTIDRPFIYLIRDQANGEILFLGRLLEP